MKTLFITLFLLPVSLMAQQSKSEMTTAIEPLSSTYLLKLTGGLILVVAVIFLVAWFVKKMNLTPQHHSGLIKVIAGLNVGSRERIMLLEIGEEQILVGLCPGRIEKLHTLATPLNTDPVESNSSSSIQSKFSQLLSNAGKNGSNKK